MLSESTEVRVGSSYLMTWLLQNGTCYAHDSYCVLMSLILAWEWYLWFIITLILYLVKFRTLSWWQHRNLFKMASSSACRWTISALVAWKLRKFSTLIGLKQFDVIGRAMRDGKARFWLNTERFTVLVTLLVKIRGSPTESWSRSAYDITISY